MILDKLKEATDIHYNKHREGIHVSDLTLCPREACFRALEPKDKDGIPIDKTKRATNTDVNFFSSGKAIHEAIQILASYFPEYEIEKEVKHGDIVGHIDLFDKTNHIPIEAKSARKGTMEEPQAHYLKQLEAYMALTNADTGIILVQLLMHFKENPFVEFYHHMNADQRAQTLKQLEKDAIQLKSGIMNLMPNLVRHIADDPDLNWKCNYCKWFNPCLAFRKLEESNSNSDSASETT